MANQYGFYTPRPPKRTVRTPTRTSTAPVATHLMPNPGVTEPTQPVDAGPTFGPTGNLGVAPPPVVAAPAPPPTPIDWNALTISDPQYTTGLANLDFQHGLNEKNLAARYAAEQQGGGDTANAHGVLNSGIFAQLEQNAATHNQTAENQETANYGSGKNNLYWNVYNRLVANPPGGKTGSGSDTSAAATVNAAKPLTPIQQMAKNRPKAPKLTGVSRSKGYSGNAKGAGL